MARLYGEELKDYLKYCANLSVLGGKTTRDAAENILLMKDKPQEVRDSKAASFYAGACEEFLKAPIITCDVPSFEGFNGLDPDGIQAKLDKILRSPEVIQHQLLPTDERYTRSLKRIGEGTSKGGHDIYAYYQLQNPIYRTLLTHAFMSYEEGRLIDGLIFGMLTDDNFFAHDEKGHIKIKSEQLYESLDKTKTAYQNFRYVCTHNGNRSVKQKELEFLMDMAGSASNVMPVFFQRPDEVDEETKHGRKDNILAINNPHLLQTVSSLENTGSNLLINEFNKSEFEALLAQLDKLDKSGKFKSEVAKEQFKQVYLNLSLYLKHCVIKDEVGLQFDSKVFERIANYCDFIMLIDIEKTPPLRNFKEFESKIALFEKRLQQQKQFYIQRGSVQESLADISDEKRATEREKLEQKSSELQKEIRKHIYDMASDKDSTEGMKKVVGEKRKELLKMRVALALEQKDEARARRTTEERRREYKDKLFQEGNIIYEEAQKSFENRNEKMFLALSNLQPDYLVQDSPYKNIIVDVDKYMLSEQNTESKDITK